MRHFQYLLPLAALGAAAQEAPNLAAPYGAPTAVIDSGLVFGTAVPSTSSSAAINKFLGIPFAVTPPKRFAPPSSPGLLSYVVNATAVKPACIQQFTDSTTPKLFSHDGPEESEDCLYLNIFAPASAAPDGGRAVVFWIYGGGFSFGTGGLPMYDGSKLAGMEDVVVVTFNYRTNVFGFPNSPEIPLGERNLGLMDQRFALDWVQTNIYAFGGSPEKVTIWGQSAGAISVDAMITSYSSDAKLPFRAAIMDSDVLSYTLTPYTSDPSGWDGLTSALGCPGDYASNLTCVRAADADTIRSVIDEQFLRFLPTPDNVTVVSDPAVRRQQGNIARVPILTGSNGMDGITFIPPKDTSTSSYLNTTLSKSPLFTSPNSPSRDATFAAIEAAYPLGSPDIRNQHDQITHIFQDFHFTCPAGAAVNATTTFLKNTPAWRYYFNASFPNTQPLLRSQGIDLGAWHSSELYLIFGYPYYSEDEVAETKDEAALSQIMREAWMGFVKDPTNGPGWIGVGEGEEDLAVLEKEGVTMIRQGEVDGKCYLYENAAGTTA